MVAISDRQKEEEGRHRRGISPTDERHKKNLTIQVRLHYTSAAVLCFSAPAMKRVISLTATHTGMPLTEAGGWEDGGHEQGMSCTDKKQTMKTKLPAIPTAAFTGCSADAALSWCLSDAQEEERWYDVSTTT